MIVGHRNTSENCLSLVKMKPRALAMSSQLALVIPRLPGSPLSLPTTAGSPLPSRNRLPPPPMSRMLQRGRGHLQRLATAQNLAPSIPNPFLFAGQGVRHKKTLMKVILTTGVDKLGRAGETVAVAPGYFRNYLMPNLLAVPNLDKYAALVKERMKLLPLGEEAVKEDEDKGTLEEKMEYIKAANILARARLSLRRFITTEKALRSPVTKEELVDEVARQLSVAIQPENLDLPVPLASLGEHEVPLRLPRKIPLPEGLYSWTLHVKIRKK